MSESSESASESEQKPEQKFEHGPEDHGHSFAAWVAVGILILASLVMSLAVVFPSVLWFVIGVVIAVIGVATGKVLSMAGYGAPKAGTMKGARGEKGDHIDRPGKSQVGSGTA